MATLWSKGQRCGRVSIQRSKAVVPVCQWSDAITGEKRAESGFKEMGHESWIGWYGDGTVARRFGEIVAGLVIGFCEDEKGKVKVGRTKFAWRVCVCESISESVRTVVTYHDDASCKIGSTAGYRMPVCV